MSLDLFDADNCALYELDFDLSPSEAASLAPTTRSTALPLAMPSGLHGRDGLQLQ